MEYPTLEDALVHEVWRQDLSAVQRLLASGANPNTPGGNWSSAIACAGENDETGDIIRVLLSAGAQINIQDSYGQTPLHIAIDMAIDGSIQCGRDTINWSVVGILLDLGADPTIPDTRGRTAYDWVLAYGENARDSFDEFIRLRSQ